MATVQTRFESKIDSIPVTTGTEFDVSDEECRSIRSFLYSINKDGIRKFRTLRDGRYLLVWRVK